MQDGFLRAALRGVFSPPNILAWIVLSAMFALSGPYGTYGALHLPARSAFWAAVFACGFLVIPPIRVALQRRWASMTFLRAAGVAAVAGGLVVALPLPRLFGLAGVPGEVSPGVMECWAGAAFLTIGVVLVRELVLHETLRERERRRRPKLLRRLATGSAAEILALSVDDHYVEVATEAGTERLLMRLSDAIDEAAPIRGIRVHRSHWVAEDAVTEVERVGGRTFVVLRNGARLPVSRAYETEVRSLRG